MAHLKRLIVCLFAVFLMSHNAGALEFTINAQQIWGNWSPSIQYLAISCMTGYTCEQYDGNYYWNSNQNSEYGWNNLTQTVKALRFQLPSGATFTNGEYVQIRVYLRQVDAGNANDAAFARPKSLTSGVEVISLDYQNLDNSDSQVVITMAFTGSIAGGSWVYLVNGGNSFLTDNNNLIYLRESGTYAVAGVGSLWAVRGDNSQAIIDAINNSGDSEAINDLKDSIEQQHTDDVDAVQEQSDAAADAADSSGDAAASTGANFIQSMGIIIDAFKNIQPSDCRIQFSATTDGLSTFMGSIGEVNLCSRVPDAVLNVARVLAALVITPVVLQCAYVLVMTLYKMFNEVQE